MSHSQYQEVGLSEMGRRVKESLYPLLHNISILNLEEDGQYDCNEHKRFVYSMKFMFYMSLPLALLNGAIALVQKPHMSWICLAPILSVVCMFLFARVIAKVRYPTILKFKEDRRVELQADIDAILDEHPEFLSALCESENIDDKEFLMDYRDVLMS